MTTFPINRPITLVVRLAHGSLNVRASDSVTEATVDLQAPSGSEAYAERVVVEMRGQALVVHAPRGIGGRSPEGRTVHATVTVPTGTSMKLSSDTASLTVTGHSGDMDIATARGDVQLGSVDGRLRVRSGSADVSVAAVSGSAQLRSGSGVKVLGAVRGDVDLASGSGEATIGLPSGVNARLDVVSGSGRVNSELPVEEQPTGDGPAIRVRIRTGSGQLTIVRAA